MSNTLKGAIARDRVAHGYLLCGPRGTGKTTLARVLAMALNCENKGADGEPCGVCTSCQRIWSGSSSLDVVEIDAASNRGVDDARELRERAMYAPSGDDRYKVYIVDEAHMLTREAWNALLKILEEPPPRVVFVFATTEPQKIAQAAAPVLSRLQRFDFKRIGAAGYHRAARVRPRCRGESPPSPRRCDDRARGRRLDARCALPHRPGALARRGTGDREAVRDALGLVPEDEYLGCLDDHRRTSRGDVFAAVARLADAGVDFGSFLSGFADMLRAQLAVLLGGVASDVSAGALERLRANAARLAAGDLLRMLNVMSELEPRFRKSGQQQLLVETLLVRFALLDRTVSLEEVLRGIGSGGASSGGSAAPDWRAALNPADPKGAQGDARDAAASAASPAGSPAAPPAAPSRTVNRSESRGELRTESRTVGRAESGAGIAATRESAAPEAPVSTRGRSRTASPLSAMRSAMEASSQGEPPVRLSDEQRRAERTATLRAKDPVLGAAIDALDLELLD